MDGYPLWMAQCTLLLLTQCMAIMNSTMYGYLPWTATHYVWHNVCYYCWHNVWLPQCPTLITLFEENQLVAISSNIKVHDSLQDHRKFISSLLLLFQLSVRSLWCTCHWDVRIGMDESRVGHQCDQIWANFATLVNFCSRWPNILSSFSAWQIMNLLWNFFTVYGNFSLI